MLGESKIRASHKIHVCQDTCKRDILATTREARGRARQSHSLVLPRRTHWEGDAVDNSFTELTANTRGWENARAVFCPAAAKSPEDLKQEPAPWHG